MEIDLGVRFKRHPNAVFTDLDGEIALFQGETCDYLVLNETGSAIWAGLASRPTLAELCELLQQEYDVTPDDCRTGVEAWLQVAVSKQVVIAVASE